MAVLVSGANSFMAMYAGLWFAGESGLVFLLRLMYFAEERFWGLTKVHGTLATSWQTN